MQVRTGGRKHVCFKDLLVGDCTTLPFLKNGQRFLVDVEDFDDVAKQPPCLALRADGLLVAQQLERR